MFSIAQKCRTWWCKLLSHWCFHFWPFLSYKKMHIFIRYLLPLIVEDLSDRYRTIKMHIFHILLLLLVWLSWWRLSLLSILSSFNINWCRWYDDNQSSDDDRNNCIDDSILNIKMMNMIMITNHWCFNFTVIIFNNNYKWNQSMQVINQLIKHIQS